MICFLLLGVNELDSFHIRTVEEYLLLCKLLCSEPTNAHQ